MQIKWELSESAPRLRKVAPWARPVAILRKGLCKTTLTLHSVCTYGPSRALLHSTPVTLAYAGVDLPSTNAVSVSTSKTQDQTGESRPRLAAARCLNLVSHWRGRRPLLGSTSSQSKKKFNADFLPNEQAPTPPPPKRTSFVWKKMSIIGDGPLVLFEFSVIDMPIIDMLTIPELS